MTNVREAAVTAAAAACSVAALHGVTNLNSVAQGAASASLATQRIVGGNADDNDDNDEINNDEDNQKRKRKRRKMN